MSPNPNWILHLQSLGWYAAAKIAVAPLLGAIVGLERVWGGHPRGHVRGLTTATSIWLVAAMGMAVGTGTYFLAVFATVYP